MRILTSNLKNVQKIWGQVRVRGNTYHDHVLLDFDTQTLAFMNSESVVKVKLNLEDNDGNGLVHRPMFVDGSKFFSLVQFYDYIDLDEEDVFYSSNGDKFILPELQEDIEMPDLEYDDWSTLTIDFTPELNKKLNVAGSYVPSDATSDFNALFVHEGTLIGCDRFKMLFAQTDNGFGGVDFNIPLALLRLILSLDIAGSIDFKVRENSVGAKMVEFEYGDLWIRYNSSTRFDLPFDPDADDFKSVYNHPNYFYVDPKELDEVVKFLMTFYADASWPVCSMNFHTSDESDLYMTLHLSYEFSGTTDYKVPLLGVTDPEYFDGKSAFIFLNYIKSAIGVLQQFGVTKMLVTFDPDSPAIAFKDADGVCPVFVIHTLTEEV